MGGIVGYFDSRELKSGQAKNFVQNCLSVGMVYPNSSSYKNDHYVGSMVGETQKIPDIWRISDIIAVTLWINKRVQVLFGQKIIHL